MSRLALMILFAMQIFYIYHLYRKAGVKKFLMGMENTNEATLKKIKKEGATQKDRKAI